MNYLIRNSSGHYFAKGGGWISKSSPFYIPAKLKKNAANKLRVRLLDRDRTLKLTIVQEN